MKWQAIHRDLQLDGHMKILFVALNLAWGTLSMVRSGQCRNSFRLRPEWWRALPNIFGYACDGFAGAGKAADAH